MIIQRSQVHLRGSTLNGERPIWKWSPRQGSGQSWPIQFRGQGSNGDALPLLTPIISGQRRLKVSGRPTQFDLTTPQWVRLTADDFGDVPPVCLGGRDIERAQRHQRQLFRLISTEVAEEEEALWVTLDRSVHLDIPLSAQPRLHLTQLMATAQ